MAQNRKRSRCLLVILGGIFLLGCQMFDDKSVVAQESPGWKSPRKPFGIYQWNRGGSYAESLRREIQILGATPATHLLFTGFGRGFRKEKVLVNDSLGIQSVVSQELRYWGRQAIPAVLDSVTQGKMDSFFIQTAREAKELGGEYVYRFGYEMNGDWMEWGEQPEKFVAAWRHVYAIFKRENANNVQWLFSPNVLWDNKTFEKDLFPYYPGDDVVDLIGLDGYNFGDDHDEWHKWQSYREVFGTTLDKVHVTWNKPIWLSEIGSADGDRKSDWMLDFLKAYENDDRLQMFIWFQEDKRDDGEHNWRVDSDSATLKVFHEWASSP